MKKIVLSLFVIVALATIVIACDSADSENTFKDIAVETSGYLEVQPITYKNHRYLWFRTKNRKGFGGVVHDPECLKHDVE